METKNVFTFKESQFERKYVICLVIIINITTKKLNGLINGLNELTQIYKHINVYLLI